MSKETDDTVAAKLQTWGVPYSVHYVGEVTKENNWKCDKFMVSFGTVCFEFHSGTGNRIPTKTWYGPRIKPAGDRKAGYVRVVDPSAASVLYCLLLDARANDLSFSNWCAEYGYDEDSMKAFRMYQECCETDKKLRAIFKPEQVAELNVLLEDY